MESAKIFLGRIRWLRKIKNDSDLIESVPEKLLTETMCLAAVSKNGMALEYVPETFKTESICLAAVKNYGLALKFTPDSCRTETVCLAALNNKAGALKYVPEKLKAKLSKDFTISLTNDEIDIFNAFVNDCDETIKISEEIRGKLINKSEKFSPKIFWNEPTVYMHSINDISFSEENTKAKVHIIFSHIFDGSIYTVYYSKENGKWKKCDEEKINRDHIL